MRVPAQLPRVCSLSRPTGPYGSAPYVPSNASRECNSRRPAKPKSKRSRTKKKRAAPTLGSDPLRFVNVCDHAGCSGHTARRPTSARRFRALGDQLKSVALGGDWVKPVAWVTLLRARHLHLHGPKSTVVQGITSFRGVVQVVGSHPDRSELARRETSQNKASPIPLGRREWCELPGRQLRPPRKDRIAPLDLMEKATLKTLLQSASNRAENLSKKRPGRTDQSPESSSRCARQTRTYWLQRSAGRTSWTRRLQRTLPPSAGEQEPTLSCN